MRILEHGEIDRVVRLLSETEGRKRLVDWIASGRLLVREYIEESKKRFPDGMTYDEAKQFLRDK